MNWKVLLSLVVIFCTASAANTTHCFECPDLPLPAYCQRTTQCAEGQKCSLEELVTTGGLVLYNSGCLSPMRCSGVGRREAEDDLTLCVECCEGDFCNRQGCGTSAKKLPDRGPLCFHCDYQDDPEKCRTVVQCRIGEVCMLTEFSPPALVDGRSIYKSSCQLPSVCAGDVLAKRFEARCHACCKEDFCNNRCHSPFTSPTAQGLHNVSTSPAQSTAIIHTTAFTQTSQDSRPSSSNANATPPMFTTISLSSAEQASTRHTSPNTPLLSSTEQSSPEQSSSTRTVSTVIHLQTQSSLQASASTSANMQPTISAISTVSTTSTPPTQTTTHASQFQERCTHHIYHYDPHSGLCYAYHNHPRTWSDANFHCKREHAKLAVVDTEEKWRFLQLFLSHNDRYPAYIGGIYTENGYHWTNGAAFQFTAWAKDQPDSSRGSCVIVNDDEHLWESSNCDSKWDFVCTMEPSTLPANTTPINSTTVSLSTRLATTLQPEPLTSASLYASLATTTALTPLSTLPSLRELCESNRYHYDDHSKLCYALHDDHATWDEANRRCKKEGGALAVIDTPEKWHILQRTISHHYLDDVFIGGRGHGTQSHNYHWTNGARFNHHFTAWGHTQPDGSQEDCVYVNHKHSTWHDTSCHRHLQFVCTMELHV